MDEIMTVRFTVPAIMKRGGSIKKRLILLLAIGGGLLATFVALQSLLVPSAKNPPSSSGPHAAPMNGQSKVLTDAWIYPDEPKAMSALQDGRAINAAKIEFLHIEDDGALTQINKSEDMPNGYSEENVALLKKHSKEQYITVSGTMAGTATAMKNPATIENIVKLAHQTGFNVELDWEEFGQWTPEYYQSFKNFTSQLAAALHKDDRKLAVDGPPIPDASSQKWYKWKYEEVAPLVDSVAMMIYDNQYDAGPGASIAPAGWSQNCLNWLKRTAGDKGVAGIAAYGYKGDEQSGKIAINTSAAIKRQVGQSQVSRTQDHDLAVKVGNTYYSYADQQTMQARLKQVEESGITRLSVWSLGDNPWF